MHRLLYRCVLLMVISLGGPGLAGEEVPMHIEAVAGEPFGVCRVHFEDPAQEFRRAPGLPTRSGRLALLEEVRRSRVVEARGRALYPARTDERLETQEALTGSREAGASILFLFRGSDPLELQVSELGPGRACASRKVSPILDPHRLKALREEWCGAFQDQTEAIRELDGYDPSVELYLTGMLARRMDLKPSESPRFRHERIADEVLALLLGTESIRLAMQTRAFEAKGTGEATLPLPTPVLPPEMPVPAFDEAKVKVEELALHVPAACFYLRSDSFDAFLKVMDLMDDRGSALRSLVSTRGVDQGLKARLEGQLVLHAGALSRLFGGAAVKELAFIGRDTFFREGSAVGLVFQARNQALLKGHLEGLRQEALAQDPSIRATTLQVGGRSVSLLESPGHRVRSFYVQDGDYHLVTNSRWMVEAFLEAGARPETSLGALKAFRYARSQVPTQTGGSFLYLSDAFFRELVGPAYRVEMSRRASADAELALVEMARAAARAEGASAEDLASLVSRGFLPEFPRRADGSRILLEKGLALDSMRGARGSLLPVPDLPVERISAAEQEAYEGFARSYERLWRNMDPVFGTLQRVSRPGGEQLSLELHISPYVKSRYGFLLAFVGQAAKSRFAPIPGDLLSLEVRLKLDSLGRGGEGPPRASAPSPTFFAGLRDLDLEWRMESGEILRGRRELDLAKHAIRGYLGQTPAEDRSLKGLLGSQHEEDMDAEGFTPLESGLRNEKKVPPAQRTWCRRLGDYLVMGTGKELVRTVSEHLKRVQDPFPAQLRLRLGDLKSTRISGRIRGELYARDRRASASGALLLQSLQEQLRVEDPQTASRQLLGFEPLDPLGGRYQAESGHWKSSAWSEPSLRQVNQVPDGYRSPLQSWIKTLSLSLAIDETTLSTRVQIDGR